jgi:hypothetical protein
MRSSRKLIDRVVITGIVALTGAAISACAPVDEPAQQAETEQETSALAAAAPARPNITAKVIGLLGDNPVVDISGKNFTKNGQVTLQIDQAGVFGGLSETPTVTAKGTGKFLDEELIKAPNAACFVTIVAVDNATNRTSNTVRVNKPGCKPPTFTASLNPNSSGPPGLTFSGDNWTPFDGVDVGVDLNGNNLTGDVLLTDGTGHIVGFIIQLSTVTCGKTIQVSAVDEATGVESKTVNLAVTCR